MVADGGAILFAQLRVGVLRGGDGRLAVQIHSPYAVDQELDPGNGLFVHTAGEHKNSEKHSDQYDPLFHRFLFLLSV